MATVCVGSVGDDSDERGEEGPNAPWYCGRDYEGVCLYPICNAGVGGVCVVGCMRERRHGRREGEMDVRWSGRSSVRRERKTDRTTRREDERESECVCVYVRVFVW